MSSSSSSTALSCTFSKFSGFKDSFVPDPGLVLEPSRCTVNRPSIFVAKGAILPRRPLNAAFDKPLRTTVSPSLKKCWGVASAPTYTRGGRSPSSLPPFARASCREVGGAGALTAAGGSPALRKFSGLTDICWPDPSSFTGSLPFSAAWTGSNGSTAHRRPFSSARDRACRMTLSPGLSSCPGDLAEASLSGRGGRVLLPWPGLAVQDGVPAGAARRKLAGLTESRCPEDSSETASRSFGAPLAKGRMVALCSFRSVFDRPCSTTASPSLNSYASPGPSPT
mmetsp:Transcript_62486/g.177551  ORF Transcript_62486/g.177551 Transcript_62486/m.177551 type:complete len:281 (-) Transcript_62486:15-857(-)